MSLYVCFGDPDDRAVVAEPPFMICIRCDINFKGITYTVFGRTPAQMKLNASDQFLSYRSRVLEGKPGLATPGEYDSLKDTMSIRFFLEQRLSPINCIPSLHTSPPNPGTCVEYEEFMEHASKVIHAKFFPDAAHSERKE